MGLFPSKKKNTTLNISFLFMKTDHFSSQTAKIALNFFVHTSIRIYHIVFHSHTYNTKKCRTKIDLQCLDVEVFTGLISYIGESDRSIYLNAVLFECFWKGRCNPMYPPLSCFYFFKTIKEGKMWISLYSWEPEFVVCLIRSPFCSGWAQRCRKLSLRKLVFLGFLF